MYGMFWGSYGKNSSPGNPESDCKCTLPVTYLVCRDPVNVSRIKIYFGICESFIVFRIKRWCFWCVISWSFLPEMAVIVLERTPCQEAGLVRVGHDPSIVWRSGNCLFPPLFIIIGLSHFGGELYELFSLWAISVPKCGFRTWQNVRMPGIFFVFQLTSCACRPCQV